MLMGLRLRDGIDLDRLEARTGYRPSSERIRPLEEQGLLAREGTKLLATASGRPVLNAVLKALLA
jgi:oxygen-independent coproporphyrinogen-3 oxidase